MTTITIRSAATADPRRLLLGDIIPEQGRPWMKSQALAILAEAKAQRDRFTARLERIGLGIAERARAEQERIRAEMNCAGLAHRDRIRATMEACRSREAEAFRAEGEAMKARLVAAARFEVPAEWLSPPSSLEAASRRAAKPSAPALIAAPTPPAPALEPTPPAPDHGAAMLAAMEDAALFARALANSLEVAREAAKALIDGFASPGEGGA